MKPRLLHGPWAGMHPRVGVEERALHRLNVGIGSHPSNRVGRHHRRAPPLQELVEVHAAVVVDVELAPKKVQPAREHRLPAHKSGEHDVELVAGDGAVAAAVEPLEDHEHPPDLHPIHVVFESVPAEHLQLGAPFCLDFGLRLRCKIQRVGLRVWGLGVDLSYEAQVFASFLRTVQAQRCRDGDAPRRTMVVGQQQAPPSRRGSRGCGGEELVDADGLRRGAIRLSKHAVQVGDGRALPRVARLGQEFPAGRLHLLQAHKPGAVHV
mmetsp:Transcript_61110/g.176104  ORF Transcript_61110/g.176104 Transcript_61110/m.176104 type:complete len:266 (+) Transcript_61110:163-960(+)